MFSKRELVQKNAVSACNKHWHQLLAVQFKKHPLCSTMKEFTEYLMTQPSVHCLNVRNNHMFLTCKCDKLNFWSPKIWIVKFFKCCYYTQNNFVTQIYSLQKHSHSVLEVSFSVVKSTYATKSFPKCKWIFLIFYILFCPLNRIEQLQLDKINDCLSLHWIYLTSGCLHRHCSECRNLNYY